MTAEKTTKKLRRAHDHRRPADDGGDAFIPDVVRTHGHLVDDEAEAFAEETIAAATSAEFVGEDARDEWTSDEVGGPFIEVGIDDAELQALRELDELQEAEGNEKANGAVKGVTGAEAKKKTARANHARKAG